MTLQLTRNAYLEKIIPEGDVAMLPFIGDSSGRVEWPEAKFPTATRDSRLRFRVTLELSETAFPSEETVEEEPATLTTHLSREVGFESGPERWYTMTDPDGVFYLGFASDDLPESFHGEDGEGYARITIEYDGEEV